MSGNYCKGICCLDKDKLAFLREKPTKITSYNHENSKVLASII